MLANLELSIFKQCAHEIAMRVAPDGTAILSGLLCDQVNECLALWPGFEPVDRKEEGGWAALTLVRIP